MANGGDGTIELNVDLNIGPAKKSAGDLNATISKALNSNSTKMQNLGVQLQKAVDKANKYNAELKRMETTKVPTEAFTNLNNKIDETSTKINKIKAEIQTMTETGTSQTYTSEYSKALEDEKWLLEQLAPLQEKYNNYKSMGFTDEQMSGQEWYQEYQALTTELQDVRGEMQAMIDLNEQYQNTEEFTQKQEQLKELETEYDNLIAKKKEMETSGTNTTTEAQSDPGKYNQVAQNASNANTQVNILDQKIREANSDSNTLKNTWKSASTSITSAVTKIGNAIKNKISSAVNSTKSSHNKSFKSMLTTVLKYGFGIRSIYFLFRKIRSTISTGLSEMSNQFSDVADDVYSLKNSWSGFKSSLVSAFQPIFSYVVPALTTLINYLTTAMNALANFFALLTGSSTYKKAVAGNESVADSVSGTGSAAEEANEELADYDDLVVIDSDSGSGGSGGGGSGSGSSWNWEEVATEASDWASMITDALTDWDFTEVGEALGDELISMMQSIPWEDIYNTASNFGKGLATFLNGLISDDLFAELGKTIANALNTGLYFLNSFASWFDWTGLGTAISSGINSFVENFDLDLAVDTFNKWANGILDTLITAVEGIKFDAIAQKIADGIEQIDASGISWKVGKLVTACCNAIEDLFSNKDTWVNLGTKMGDGINGFFKGFSGDDLGDAIDSIKDALETAIGTAVKRIDWDQIGLDISDLLNSIDVGEVFFAITAIALTAKTKAYLATKLPEIIKSETTILGASGGVSLGTVFFSVIASLTIGWQIGTELYESITGEEVEQSMLEEMFDILDWLGGDQGTMASRIKGYALQVINPFSIPFKFAWEASGAEELFEKIKTSISETIDNVQTWLEENGGNFIIEGLIEGAKAALLNLVFPGQLIFDWIVDTIKTTFGIASPAKKMYEYGEYILEGIIEGFKNAFTNIGTAIGELKDKIVNKIKEKFGDIIDKAKEAIGEFSITKLLGIAEDSNIISIATEISSVFSGGLTSLVDFETFEEVWDTIKTTFKNIKATITAKLSGVFSKITDISSMKEKVTDLWNSWKDKAADLKATLSGKISEITDLDSIKTKMANLRTEWANKAADFKATVSGAISKITDLDNWKSKMSNLQDVWKNKAAEMKATLGGAISKIDTLGDWQTAFTNLKNAWVDKAAKFTTSFDKTQDQLGTWKTKITNLCDAWKDKSATFSLKFSAAASDLKSWVNTNVINKINTQFKKVPILKNHLIPTLARGGIVDTATMFVAGEAGQEAVIPLERNLGWLDTMASMISDKLADTPIPLIANGNILPMTEAFTKSAAEVIDNSKLLQIVEEILNRLNTLEETGGVHPTIPVYISGIQVAQVVWDETNKRYKQSGQSPMFT